MCAGKTNNLQKFQENPYKTMEGERQKLSKILF